MSKEESMELCSSRKKKRQNILFACVDICDSDCEITYFNTKLFRSKNLTAAEDNNGKENFNGSNSKSKMQSKFKADECCSEIEENIAHPMKNDLMDFIINSHDLPEKMELYLTESKSNSIFCYSTYLPSGSRNQFRLEFKVVPYIRRPYPRYDDKDTLCKERL